MYFVRSFKTWPLSAPACVSFVGTKYTYIVNVLILDESYSLSQKLAKLEKRRNFEVYVLSCLCIFKSVIRFPLLLLLAWYEHVSILPRTKWHCCAHVTTNWTRTTTVVSHLKNNHPTQRLIKKCNSIDEIDHLVVPSFLKQYWAAITFMFVF